MGMGAGCFPGEARVRTTEGERDISSLRIGDQVLAADDTGKMVYSEVDIYNILTINVIR